MIMSLLATYALSTILVNVAILIWGGGYSGLPGVLSGSIRILGINVSISRLVSFVCAIGVSLAVWWVLRIHPLRPRGAIGIAGAGACEHFRHRNRARTARDLRAWHRDGRALPACWLRRRLRSIPSSARASSSRRLPSSSSAAWAAIPARFSPRCCSASIEVVGSYFAGAVIGSAFLFLLMLCGAAGAAARAAWCGCTDMKGIDPLGVVAIAAVIAVVMPLCRLGLRDVLLDPAPDLPGACLFLELDRRLRRLHPFRPGRLFRHRRLCRLAPELSLWRALVSCRARGRRWPAPWWRCRSAAPCCG